MRILMIAEKDSQADNIADALHLSYRTKRIKVKKGHYEDIPLHIGTYKGNEITLIGTGGHLMELRGRSSQIVYFGFKWRKPTLRHKNQVARYKFIKKTILNVSEVIIATDADEEGELIGYNLIKQFDAISKATRMSFVSMTERAIQNAYYNRGAIRQDVAISAELRTWMDKVFGYIFSKFLTRAYCSATGAQYIQLPVGRVMTPSLSFVLQKNVNEIEKAKKLRIQHKPKIIYSFKLIADLPCVREIDYDDKNVNIDEQQYGLTLEQAQTLREKYKDTTGKIISVNKEKKTRAAPNAGLTIDEVTQWAYKQGIDFPRTEAILEALYLNKLISYPRSESTILPEEPEYHASIVKNCLDRLGVDKSKANGLIERDVPKMGEDYDGAHYAIHPTEIKAGKLPPDYTMIYDYIVQNYTKGFCKDMEYYDYTYRAAFEINGSALRLYKQNSYWKTIIDYGFKIVENPAYLNYEKPEIEIVPEVEVGSEVKVDLDIKKQVDTMRLPDRVKKDDLHKFMRKNKLGTDATRGSIMEKLWNLNMLRGDPPIPTVLGMRIYDVIKEINPKLTKPTLTKEFEEMRLKVENQEKSADQIKENLKSIIQDIIDDKLDELNTIGNDLAFFGNCQKCDARMKLISWNKNGQYLFFLACENEECDFTSPI